MPTIELIRVPCAQCNGTGQLNRSYRCGKYQYVTADRRYLVDKRITCAPASWWQLWCTDEDSEMALIQVKNLSTARELIARCEAAEPRKAEVEATR
jgi:hypothetical protein